MKPLRILTLVTIIFLVWKTIRTDWVVSAPYWFGDSDPPASSVFSTEHFYPPVRPLWSPPEPANVATGTKSWSDYFPGGGAYGITGDPVLRPNWLLMLVKYAGIVISIAILLLVVRLFQRLSRRSRRSVDR
jgi:hypothetical protein